MKQKITILIYLLTGIMAVSGIADAALTNGGFEEGTLNGWTPDGGVAVIPSGGMSYFDVNSGDIFLDAPEGSKFVLLSTGPSSTADIDIDGNGVPDFDIATLSRTFTLDANQVPAVISFKWSFLTSEVSVGENFFQDDFFQVNLTKKNNIGTAFLKGSVPGNGQSTSGFPDVGILDEHQWFVLDGVLAGDDFVDGKTDFQSSNYQINEPGEYTLEFLVADQLDTETNSGLIIDDVTLTALGLQDVGPTSSANGYPIWYEDANGLRLEPCLSGPNGFDPNCALAADPGFDISQPIVFPTNFPEEMFYWSADGSMDIGNDTGSAGRARLVLALEGAFTNGPVAADEQAVFGRVRIVMDAPEAGIYTVTHPYGVDVFNVTEPGPRAVFYTQDHGCFGLQGFPCNFSIPLSSRLGPFLTSVDAPPPPAGYIGDGATPYNVTGSPFGTNFFRIDGPAGVDLNPDLPDVQTSITTNLFVLTGRLFSGSANITGLKINDNNSNGIPDTGEGIVPGWKITVSNDTRGFIVNTTTDSSGLYRLLNIPNGTYNISEEVIAGWENTTSISNVITVANTESAVVNFTNRFLVDHGVSMAADKSSRITQPNINATYVITVTNTGHFPDTFALAIQNPEGAAAALNMPDIALASGMSGTVLLNVTGGRRGSFMVNVTATSQTDANATMTLGTITKITGLQAVGPVNASNGFPEWYLDANGLPLEPCLAGPDGLADTNCALAADSGFNISQPIVFPANFPEEMFYWSADGSMDIGNDTGSAGRARLVLALEGAFTDGPVAVDEQAVFGRVRIVMDAPEAGIYTVTHPYGVDVFNVTEPGPRAVFYTQDHGCFGLPDFPCNFSIPLSSRLGPFLTSVDAPPPPAGYIGDGATPYNVTGSPFNTNFFRIDGPAGVDLNPDLPDVQTNITTNLFVLTGKILQDAASITGFKINDSSANGISDPGEQGIMGWNISVKNPVTGQVNNTATEANGSYQFINLVPGNYIVTEEANASWMNSSATSKTVILNGFDSTNKNFTNFLPGRSVELFVNGGLAANLTTPVNINATYVLTVNNTGNVEHTFNLTITNQQNAMAALNMSSITLGSGMNGTALLNVTNASPGNFVVNVTAASQADQNINATISTTTEVVPALAAPVITIQPLNQTVTEGQNATFSVTATGTPPLSYQWHKNGVAIAGATASTYTTPPTALADNGTNFSVNVSNAAGNVTSDNATLTVTTSSQIRFINGTVIDSVNKTGIFGVTVSTNTSLSTTTDAAGFYSFNVTAGTYNLTAKLDPAYYANTSVIVSTELSGIVIQDIELLKKPTGNIAGTVTASSSYTISVSTSPAGLVPSPTGGGQYFSGQTATVTAQSVNGYTFKRWTEGANQVSTSPVFQFTVTGDRNLVAEYTPGSLAGWWKFDNDMNDSSGNGNNGTCSGSGCPTSTTGKIAGALFFDGTNDYINAGNRASLNITGNITIEAWVKPGRLATAYLVKKASSGTTDGYELSLSSSTGKAYFRVNQKTSGDTYKLFSASKYPVDGNTWIHLAGVYNGSHVQIYFNGKLENSMPGPAKIISNTDSLEIGGPDDSRYFRGAIDEVRVWNRALSPQEINASYSSGIQP